MLPNENKTKDNVVIVNQKEIEKQRVLEGRIQLQKGHRLFEINITTNEINEAVYDTKDVILTKDKKTLKVKSITMKDDCFYIGALNKKNAIKKFNK